MTKASGEFPDFGEGAREGAAFSFEMTEVDERYLEVKPVFDKVTGFLLRAKASDEALEEVAGPRTRRFKIRSAGNDDFPFAHDHVTLIPKRREETIIARRDLRFAVSERDQENQTLKTVFITDFDSNGDAMGDFILTETTFGWYSDDVRLHLREGKLGGIEGLEHEKNAPAFLDAQMEMFELDHQTNHSEAA
ncbi:MAG: hypothetical protein U5L95_02160 [Candidatus Saccharibacteria bacterium]|nr:hypothetical protein [Candidatus Saccharibacteria bacterium]